MEAKPGSGCCPRGTAPTCLAHRHPGGGDRLAVVESAQKNWGTAMSGVHRHVQGGGTATGGVQCTIVAPPLFGHQKGWCHPL